MQTKIEGILISKMPYKERDLIGRLLLRSGKKVSLFFYGGRSGGKRYRSSVLEIGHLLSVELRRPKIVNDQAPLEAKEWELKWGHQKIRESFRAFYLLSFYCEMVDRISQKEDLSLDSYGGETSHESIGIFRVLSNGIYYLDEALAQGHFDQEKFFSLFLGKLIFELGIAPELIRCVYCGNSFGESLDLHPRKFVVGEGGFACQGCTLSHHEKGDDWGLFRLLTVLKRTPYAHNHLLPSFEQGMAKRLFHHLSYHFNLKDSHFYTLKNLM